MFGNAESPLRICDLQKLIKNKNPNTYICLGGSVSCIDGSGGKLANRFSHNDKEIILYFEDEENLVKDKKSNIR